MKKQLWSDLFWIGVGIVSGSLVFHELQAWFSLGRYFWVVGALAGSLVGGSIAWVAGDFKEVRISFMRSWRVSAPIVADAFRSAKDWRWTPNKLYWKAVAARVAGFDAIMLSVWLLINHFVFKGESFQQQGMALILSMSAATMYAMASAFLDLWRTSCETPGHTYYKEDEYERRLINEAEKGWWKFKSFNPIAILIWLFFVGKKTVVYLWENRVRIKNGVIATCKEIGPFFERALRYAHSKRRKARAISAFIGTVTGCLFGHTIIGLVIGETLGILMLEVVAPKWLKIVPA